MKGRYDFTIVLTNHKNIDVRNTINVAIETIMKKIVR